MDLPATVHLDSQVDCSSLSDPAKRLAGVVAGYPNDVIMASATC